MATRDLVPLSGGNLPTQLRGQQAAVVRQVAAAKLGVAAISHLYSYAGEAVDTTLAADYARQQALAARPRSPQELIAEQYRLQRYLADVSDVVDGASRQIRDIVADSGSSGGLVQWFKDNW